MSIKKSYGDDDKPKNEEQQQTKFENEKEIIKYLEEKRTNFVFLFGREAVGKTGIVASVLHHLSINPDYLVEVSREENNSIGTNYVLEFRDAIKERRFPGRSSQKETLNLDIVFSIKNRSGNHSDIPLTFLEMSGEVLREVAVKYKDHNNRVVDGKGKFPSHIDVYFKADGLSMLFILVTTPERASNDDTFMNEFLDYISSKDRKYRNAYVCLLVTQYDRFKHLTRGLNIHDFIKSRMPNSYARFYNSRNMYAYYSVGEAIEIITDKDENGVEIKGQHIRKIDEDSPHKLFSWIYKTITKKELNPPTFWEWIEKFFDF